MASFGKKGDVPLDTPPELRPVSRLNQLLQCVNAGAKVYVKRRSVHHQSWDRLDSGCFCFFHPRFIRAEMDVFHIIFRWIQSVGDAVLGCDAYGASCVVEKLLWFSS